MLHYKTSVDINRPVGQVFAYVTDVEQGSQWGDAVAASWKVTAGPVGVGTIIKEKVKAGPVETELSWEITAYEPDQLCTYTGESELGRSETSYIFAAQGAGTRLTVEVNTQLTGMMKYFKPVIAFLHKRNRQNSLQTIKANLEQMA